MELIARWKTDRLGRIATLQRGFDLPQRFRRPGPFPIVTSSGTDAWHSEAKVQGPGVVTGRYGTIGKVFFIDGPFWPLNTTLYVRNFHGNDPLFVAYLLRTVNFDEHSGKTGVPGVNRNDLHEITLSIPPARSEQEAIAGALSDTDALIELLEHLLAKKRQIKQGAMQELLTGQKRLPGFNEKESYSGTGTFGRIPNDWKPVRLEKVSAFITKGATPTTYGHIWQQEGIPFLRSECVSEVGLDLSQSMFINQEAHDSLRRSEVIAGDLLMTITGNVGRVVRLADDFPQANINQHIARIRIVDGTVSAQFVLHFLCQPVVRRYYTRITTGQAYPQLSLVQVRETEIPLPAHAEQTAIAAVLSDMDAEINALETKLAKVCQVKQGMMQELLTGKIRLVQASAEIVPLPTKQSASASANANHNAQINEAVVLAILAHKFGSEQFPLGRFRRTKLSYLLHRHVERQVTGFMKKAAGPYNPRTRYGGAEKIALKNNYVRIHKAAKSEGIIASDNIAQAEGYFESWYGLQVLDWLKQFRYRRNEELELLTTVDMAIEDLRREGKIVTVSAVKQIIHDSPEWKAKLDRATFADSNITAAIESCRQLFPVEE